MPVTPMSEILQDAFARRYGVAAFNIVNELTLTAVLDAAAETRSPVIAQVSVKTVKQMGIALLPLLFRELASRVPVPATLHLDHCPDRSLIEACIDAGWNSVLFDASNVDYATNLRETAQVVQIAHRNGVAVEGELEAVKGVEDDVGSAEAGDLVPLDLALAFVRQTGIDSFAPAIGTAHGVYREEPTINFDRVEAIVAAHPIPIVLHGGTGLRDEVIRRLIALGAVKVNISTLLKMTYTNSLRAYLNAHPEQHDPARLHEAVKREVQTMAAERMQVLGSTGKAP